MHAFIQSFHISTCKQIMHIDANLWLLEHFERDKMTKRSGDLWAVDSADSAE